MLNYVAEKSQFSWQQVNLPAVTRLRLRLSGVALYKGAAAFLKQHTALVHLDISTLVVSAAEHHSVQEVRHASSAHSLQPVRSRTRAQEESLQPRDSHHCARDDSSEGEWQTRPLVWLNLDIPATAEVFAAAALIRGLTHLRVNQAIPGWLDGWMSTEYRDTAFPLLQEYVLQLGEQPYMQRSRPATTRDLLPFLQSMARRPLVRLVVRTYDDLVSDAAAMAQLARCSQLEELKLDFSSSQHTFESLPPKWMDWSDPGFFDAFSARCLSRLRSIRLQHVKLSPSSVVALASAAPLLQECGLKKVQLSCHPSVVCAILTGHCEYIEHLYVDDSCCHLWRRVNPAEVVNAYQSAMAAAGRRNDHKSFTQLRTLHTVMCWCTPGSVWHTLLSLLRHAGRLHHVNSLCSDDPRTVAALNNLPSLNSMSANCLLPAAFGKFMQRTDEQTGRYRFVACRELAGSAGKWIHNDWPTLELSDKERERATEDKGFELIDWGAQTETAWELLPSLLLRPSSDPSLPISARSDRSSARCWRGGREAVGILTTGGPMPLCTRADLRTKRTKPSVSIIATSAPCPRFSTGHA